MYHFYASQSSKITLKDILLSCESYHKSYARHNDSILPKPELAVFWRRNSVHFLAKQSFKSAQIFAAVNLSSVSTASKKICIFLCTIKKPTHYSAGYFVFSTRRIFSEQQRPARNVTSTTETKVLQDLRTNPNIWDRFIPAIFLYIHELQAVK